jgi:hypothetical protein
MARIEAWFFALLSVTFSICVGAVRVIQERETNGNVMHGAAHVMGLHLEHDMSQKWPLAQGDSTYIQNVIDLLNECGDSEWKWEDAFASWTFGFVRLTADGPRRALALHMLHRHGLGARIAAMHEEAFNAFLEEKRRNHHLSGQLQEVDLVTEALEEFPPVQQVLGLLESNMSLSGLRNVHSFDHSWSTEEGFGDGCSDSNAANCVLQAGISPSAHQLLLKYGFTSETCPLVEARQKDLFRQANMNILDAMDKVTFTPGLLNHPYAAKLSKGALKINGDRVKGTVCLEDLPSECVPVDFPVSEEAVARVQVADADVQQDLLLVLFEQHLSEVMRPHKDFMRQNADHFWAGEDAEFASLKPTKSQQEEISGLPQLHSCGKI